jgi:peptide/nickel transport system substrate-binding protein
MKKKYIVGFALILVLLSAVAACGQKDTATPTGENAGGETVGVEATVASSEPVVLRVGGLQDVDCWNPFSCTAIYMWGDLLVEGLTIQGKASEGCDGEPALADSWELSDDGLTWTIKLHEGITFPDGTPVTAQTVKEFYEWWASIEDIAVFNAELLYLDKIEVIDDLTFTLTTFEPIHNSPDYGFIWMWVFPPDIWEAVDPADLFTVENPPVGTGPYVLAEYVPGSHMILNAREDYYRGKPPIDQIVYTIYANPDALNNALLAGEIDLTLPFLTPESYDLLSADPNITIEEKFPGDTYNLAFNMKEAGTTHPAIKDPVVREAIDYAIDKEQVVEVVFLGHAITCPTNYGCGPNFGDDLNPDLEITPYDPVTANQLLEDAGYIDTDEDGVRETPDGQPLEFRLTYITDFPPAATMSEMIANWLAEIGIQVSIEAVDWGTWYYVVTDQRDFDMTIDFALGNIDPVAMDYWHSCWASEPGGYSTSGYCNEDFDSLVYDYWFGTDPEARKESLYAAEQMLHDDRPFIIIAGPKQIQAYRNDRFEFPTDTCYDNLGMFTPNGVLNAVPQE